MQWPGIAMCTTNSYNMVVCSIAVYYKLPCGELILSTSGIHIKPSCENFEAK